MISVCGLVVVLAVCYFCLHEREPSYNGRTLSEWLVRYDTARLVTHIKSDEDEAMHAVEVIGADAIPYLVRWNGGDASRLQEMLSQCANAVPSAAGRKVFVRLLGSDGSEKRHRLANAGFKILGTNAIAALPELAAQFATSHASAINFTAYSLAQFGLLGIEKLTNTMAADAMHRRAAVNALERLARFTRDESILNAATNAVDALNANATTVRAAPKM